MCYRDLNCHYNETTGCLADVLLAALRFFGSPTRVSWILQSEHLILNPSKTCLHCRHCVRVGASQTTTSSSSIYLTAISSNISIQVQQTCSTSMILFSLAQLVSDMFKNTSWNHMISHVLYFCTINNMSHHHQTNDIFSWSTEQLWCSQVQGTSIARNDQGEGETALWILRFGYLGDFSRCLNHGTSNAPGHIAEIPPKMGRVETGQSSIDPSVIPTEWAEHVFFWIECKFRSELYYRRIFHEAMRWASPIAWNRNWPYIVPGKSLCKWSWVLEDMRQESNYFGRKFCIFLLHKKGNNRMFYRRLKPSFGGEGSNEFGPMPDGQMVRVIIPYLCQTAKPRWKQHLQCAASCKMQFGQLGFLFWRCGSP